MKPTDNKTNIYSSNLSSSLESAAPVSSPVVPKPPENRSVFLSGVSRQTLFKLNNKALLVTVLIALVITILTAFFFWVIYRNDQKNQDITSSQQNLSGDKYTGYNVGTLPLDGSNINQLQSPNIGQITINGQLQVGDNLVLTPQSAPDSPQKGLFYFDINTNQPYYFNGTTFVSLAPTPQQTLTLPSFVASIGGSTGAVTIGNGLQISNNQLSLSAATTQIINGSRVTSIQGQTGDVNFTAGSGIVINGTTISATTGSSGVTGSGTAGRIAKFTDSGTVGDSFLNESGTTLSSSSDNFYLQPTVNSTSTFLVQNAAGQNLLQVDSVNNAITLGGNNSPELQPWTTSGNVPSNINGSRPIIVNGYIYMAGNLISSAATYSAKLNANGSVGTWNAQSTPATGVNYAGPVSANGYIYLLGGQTTGSKIATVQYAKLGADGTIGTWSTTTSLPEARYAHASFAANGYVYVIAGANSTQQPTSTTYYAKINADGTLGTWNTSTSLPNTSLGPAYAMANGYVYVAGGQEATGTCADECINTVYFARLNSDGTVGAWTTTTNTGLPAMTLHRAIVSNGYMYIIGGTNTSSGTSQTVYYSRINSDGTLGSWTLATQSLPLAVHGASLGSANGYLYSIGGGGATTSVFYTSGQRTTVGGSLDLIGLGNGSLADQLGSPGAGSIGGSLTAGDTRVAGILDVAGQASFMQGVQVNGNIVGAGQLYIQGANSTSAAVIQNSSGQNLFKIDSTNNVFTIGGNNSPAIQSWTALPNYIDNANGGRPVIANGYIFMAGSRAGGSGETYSAKLNADGTIGSWSLQTNLVKPVNFAGTIAANGYIYVLGGNSNSPSSREDMVQYAKIGTNGSIGTWATTTDLPDIRHQHASFVANGYIYVVGGDNDTFDPQTTTYYARINADGTLGAWSTTTALGTAAESPAYAMANGYIYVIGGKTASGDCATFCVNTVRYAKLNSNGTVGTWNTTVSTGLPALTHHRSVVMNGYMYVIGGENAASNVNNEIYYARINTDGTLGTWTQSSVSFPVDTHAISLATANGYMYAIGGFGGVSNVYYTSGQRIIGGGSLDLVGLADGTLDDNSGNPGGGSVGGSLTAGDTRIIGALDVAGQAYIGNSLQVAGNFNTSSQVAFQNAAGTATIFSADPVNSIVKIGTVASPTQAGSALFAASAEISGALRIGDATNRIQIDGVTRKISYHGAARQNKRIILAPIYPGAVLEPDGTSNSGTMTNGFCSGSAKRNLNTGICTGANDEFNYYSWTGSGGVNDYDIYLRWQVPSDFSAFESQSAISMYGWRTSASESVSLSLYQANGTICGSAQTITSADATWQQANHAGDETACTVAANDILTFRIRLTADNAEFARAGNIQINYLSSF